MLNRLGVDHECYEQDCPISNLRRNLVTGSYFRSRDEDGGDDIRSTVAENAMLHANFTAVGCVLQKRLVDKFNVRGSSYVLQCRFTKFGEITQNKSY